VSKAEIYVVLVGERLWMAEKKAIVEQASPECSAPIGGHCTTLLG
jgi:hypothetical protein